MAPAPLRLQDMLHDALAAGLDVIGADEEEAAELQRLAQQKKKRPHKKKSSKAVPEPSLGRAEQRQPKAEGGAGAAHAAPRLHKKQNQQKRRRAPPAEHDGDDVSGDGEEVEEARPPLRRGDAPASGLQGHPQGHVKGGKQQQQRPQQRWPFEVDSHDHFETSLEACGHAAPVLRFLATSLGKTEATLRVYDPFFCQGAVVEHWRALGFHNVHNPCEDFYARVQAGDLPEFDVLVTNPPYSGEHKERALAFCAEQAARRGKPWLLLMPNYCANKEWFASILASAGAGAGGGRQPQQGRPPSSKQRPLEPFFVVPSTKYAYTHPQGAGFASSPFFSIWYVHLGTPKRQAEGRAWLQAAAPKEWAPAVGEGGARVVTSVADLRQAGAVPSWKRPNPRQRKKLKQQQQQDPRAAPGQQQQRR